MLQIRTTRSILYFYVTLIVSSLFFVAMAAAVFFNPIKNWHNNTHKTIEYLSWPIGFIVLFIAFYCIRVYIKNSPRIYIDKVIISFNNETFYWKDIDHIALTGKQPFPGLRIFLQDTVTLTFKDNQVRYIFDNIYTQTAEIKYFLHETVINKRAITTIPDYNHHEISDTDYFEIFKGNKFTTINWLFSWPMVIGLLLAVVKLSTKNLIPLAFSTLGLACVLFFGVSRLLNYFKVSQHYLVVKNHNLLWINKTYRLQDIYEVRVIKTDKGIYGLRVVLKNFKSGSHWADTLRKNDWIALRDNLQAKGITVENDGNYWI